jgi:hypothetical protein
MLDIDIIINLMNLALIPVLIIIKISQKLKILRILYLLSIPLIFLNGTNKFTKSGSRLSQNF